MEILAVSEINGTSGRTPEEYKTSIRYLCDVNLTHKTKPITNIHDMHQYVKHVIINIRNQEFGSWIYRCYTTKVATQPKTPRNKTSPRLRMGLSNF